MATMLNKLTAVYLVGVGTAVAAYFIVNPFISEAFESFDAPAVWHVLDVLMAIALALALVFNFSRKLEAERAAEGASALSLLEAKTAFYLTAGVTILFLHNWFSLLALGNDSLEGNHQAWVIWAVVDTALPLIMWATGYRLWRKASSG